MMKPLRLSLLFLGLCARPALAQVFGAAPSTSPSLGGVFLTTAPSFGSRISIATGPWVIGDVRFQGNLQLTEYMLSTKVRARRGVLYTPADIDGDVKELMGLGYAAVNPGLFAMPEDPVPQQYASISVSTSMARLVFFVTEKSGTTPPRVSTGPAAAKEPPPAALSGVVMTPTAYRGRARNNRPGLALDFNAVYYIGRLYGKNALPYTLRKTNYLDRVGQWFYTANGKMQLQSEGRIRPAAAVGFEATALLRDGGQPAIATPGISIDVSRKSNRILTDSYLVLSKKFGPVRSSAGYMQGSAGEQIGFLSEFLAPQALAQDGHDHQEAKTKSVFFLSLLSMPKPAYPLAVEFIKPNGMPLGPYLLNFKLGYFLHLNFDLAYLKYAGAWDLLGMFQFRFNYFPRD